MNKTAFKPGNMLYPLPAVMVSCGTSPEDYNIITIAWTGTLCTNPPLCYISVRKERHSHAIIAKTGEFVINLTTKDLLRQTDWCGVRSGKDLQKFEEMQLSPLQGQILRTPIIGESPVNIECKVLEIKELGSHDMFIAEVVSVNVNANYLDPISGEFMLHKANLIAYSHGKYYSLSEQLGFFGFSVQKKPRKK